MTSVLLYNIQKVAKTTESLYFPHCIFSEKCQVQLGMETYQIPDEAITASSSHDKKSVGPQNARWVDIKQFFWRQKIWKAVQ